MSKTRAERKAIRHPATFPPKILEEIDYWCDVELEAWPPGNKPVRILDPFVGIGNIADLAFAQYPLVQLYGSELESEWGLQARKRGILTQIGDSRYLPWENNFFDAVITSPAYGNRLADKYAPDMSDKKHRARRSYRIYLERELSEGNGGGLHWGDEYRELHEAIWAECARVLKPGGVFILNCKDHNRNGKRCEVTGWHVGALQRLGMRHTRSIPVSMAGDQNTNTMRSRGIDVLYNEWIILFRKGIAQ